MQEQTIGAYQIQGEIARGAMGVVYRGFDPALSRPVAIKVLLAQSATEEDLSRFRLEATATAKLRHPNIVAIQSAGAAHGRPYLVMDLIAGGSIKQRLKERGPFAELDAVRMVEKLARALDYAHSLGVLHRDVKPHNILIDERGEPLLTDFGLAKVLGRDTQITLSGDIQGTPVYMPPEQALGEREKIGPASDVYSLGATLHEMLTGEPPFEGTTVVSVLTNVITSAPVPVSSARPLQHPELDTICLRCLAKAPGDRYRSAAALADALRDVVRNAELAATGAAPPPKRTALGERPAPTGSAKLVLGGLIIAGLAAGGIAWGVLDARKTPAPTPAEPRELPPPKAPVVLSPEEAFAAHEAHVRGLLTDNKVSDARSAFDAAELPGDASATWLLLGSDIAFAEFEYDRAIGACNAAYRVDRELEGFHWKRGRARLQLHGDSVDGISDLEDALKLGSDTIDVRLALAHALIETGSPADGVRALGILDESKLDVESAATRALAASHRALYWSYQYASQSDPGAVANARSKALAECERALVLTPTSSHALARRGGVHLAMFTEGSKEFDAGHNDLRRAIELNPRDPLPYRVRGLYNARHEGVKKDGFKLAQPDLEAALARGARDAEVYSFLTYSTVKNMSPRNGLAAKVEAYSERLLKLSPDQPKAHYWHGLAIAEQNLLPGGTDEARASAKRELDAYYRVSGHERNKTRKTLTKLYPKLGFPPPD